MTGGDDTFPKSLLFLSFPFFFGWALDLALYAHPISQYL
jgi:hypothetical protein